MADKKISQLTSATTPLAGTEVLPIVQSATTVKVATDDLTVKNVRSNATSGILQIAGPAAASTRTMTVPDANFTAARTDAANSFTGNQTLSDGNLVVGTAGKGIDFSSNTHAAGMTSELLTWYEEGTWTPTDESGAGLTFSNSYGSYTRIGRMVFATVIVVFPSTANTLDVVIAGLPFNFLDTNSVYSPSRSGAAVTYSDAGFSMFTLPSQNSKRFYVYNQTTATTVKNNELSGKAIRVMFAYSA